MRRELVAALTTQLIKEIDPLPAAVWRLLKVQPEKAVVSVAESLLLAKDAANVMERLERQEEYEEALWKLSEAGISFLTEFSVEYPSTWLSKLGDRSPSHLFVAGNVGLLQMASLGVVGSRDVDEAGAAFTHQVAIEAVQMGLSVISGGARGVDEIAMNAALEAGGSAVGILAESLAKTMRKWDLASERVCLATPFAPDIGFMVSNAMSRNKLIYAGSEATVIVSSSLDTGGTWAGATEALKQNLCPLLVRSGADVPEGNKALLGKGGVSLFQPGDLGQVLVQAQTVQGSLL